MEKILEEAIERSSLTEKAKENLIKAINAVPNVADPNGAYDIVRNYLNCALHGSELTAEKLQLFLMSENAQRYLIDESSPDYFENSKISDSGKNRFKEIREIINEKAKELKVIIITLKSREAGQDDTIEGYANDVKALKEKRERLKQLKIIKTVDGVDYYSSIQNGKKILTELDWDNEATINDLQRQLSQKEGKLKKWKFAFKMVGVVTAIAIGLGSWFGIMNKQNKQKINDLLQENQKTEYVLKEKEMAQIWKETSDNKVLNFFPTAAYENSTGITIFGIGKDKNNELVFAEYFLSQKEDGTNFPYLDFLEVMAPRGAGETNEDYNDRMAGATNKLIEMVNSANVEYGFSYKIVNYKYNAEEVIKAPEERSPETNLFELVLNNYYDSQQDSYMDRDEFREQSKLAINVTEGTINPDKNDEKIYTAEVYIISGTSGNWINQDFTFSGKSEMEFIEKFKGAEQIPDSMEASPLDGKNSVISLDQLKLGENEYFDENGNIIFPNTSESTQNTGNSKKTKLEFGLEQ